MGELINYLRDVTNYGVEGYLSLFSYICAIICLLLAIKKNNIVLLAFPFLFLGAYFFDDAKHNNQEESNDNYRVYISEIMPKTSDFEASVSNKLTETIQRYDDGDVYVGQLSEGKREGYGIYYWTDGSRYEGWWHEGKFEGFGIYQYDDDQFYEGYWHSGNKHGKGIFCCNDFIGEESYYNGLRDTTTIYYYNNGDRTVHVFNMDSLMYINYLVFPENASGCFDFNAETARVEYHAENEEDYELINSIYEAFPYSNAYPGITFSIVDNTPDEIDLFEPFTENLIKYTNGDVYRGQLLDGKREGYGKYYYSGSKQCYEGWWHNGFQEGKGELYYSNGSHFNGLWHEGKKNGYGILFEDFSMREAIYKNGLIDGESVVYNISNNRTIEKYSNGDLLSSYEVDFSGDLGAFAFNDISRRIEFLTTDLSEYNLVNNDYPTILFNSEDYTKVVVNPVLSEIETSDKNKIEVEIEDSHQDYSYDKNDVDPFYRDVVYPLKKYWWAILVVFLLLFVIKKLYNSRQITISRKTNIILKEKKGYTISEIQDKKITIEYYFLNSKAKIVYKEGSRENTIFINRNYKSYKYIEILSPFPYRFFYKYYVTNINSKYWSKNKYEDLKRFIVSRIWSSDNYEYSIKEINKCYYLCTRIKVCYYDYYKNPGSDSYNTKIYDIVETSASIQNKLVDFLKDNRSFWEKTKAFIKSHPRLVGFTLRVGAAVVFAGISELLIDLMGDGADPSGCFTIDGSDPADSSIDVMEIEADSYNDSSMISDDSSMISDDSSSGYNVSFRAQKETLSSMGNGSTIEVTIKKVPGTSNQFDINFGSGTPIRVYGTDTKVKIGGIFYKLPHLKG